MYSVVTPVYKNEDGISDLLVALSQLNRDLGHNLEAVLVVDGSPDQSAEILQKRLPEQSFRSQLILLSRNFGSFAAIRVGLEHAHGPLYAVLAADLQEPPDLLRRFFVSLEADEADVVLGTRETRADSFFTRLPAQLFWSMYRRLVVHQMPPGGVDVFGCSQAFRDYLLTCEETNTSLIALVLWLGFRRKDLPYHRVTRQHGRSAWSFRKRLNYLLDSIFAFTDLPVKALLALGAGGVAFSFLFGIAVLVARWSGHVALAGYAPTILAVLFFGGINVFGLGIVGSYAWRAYENTKRRPLAVTMRTWSYPPHGPGEAEL